MKIRRSRCHAVKCRSGHCQNWPNKVNECIKVANGKNCPVYLLRSNTDEIFQLEYCPHKPLAKSRQTSGNEFVRYGYASTLSESQMPDII